MILVVGDIADQLRGVTYAKDEARSEPKDGYLPILRANNITEDGLSFFDLTYVPSSRVTARQRLQCGDVVIAASSGSLDVVGKSAALEDEFSGSFGAFCKVLRPNQKSVDTRYFSHFFRTRDYRRKISSLAAGLNINNLKNEHLDGLKIPLPSLDEQRRIAAILDKADALRRKGKRVLDLLDSLSQSIFQEMFGQPFHGKITLADLVSSDERINYGVVQPGDDSGEGVKLIRVSDLNAGKVKHDNLRFVARSVSAQHPRSLIRGNEILVSCVGSIGEIALASEREAGFNIARAVARIPIEDDLVRRFVFSYLKSKRVQNYFIRELRTVSQPTLNIKQISETPIEIPSILALRQFSERVEKAYVAYERAAVGRTCSDALFFSLQSRAFSGQL